MNAVIIGVERGQAARTMRAAVYGTLADHNHLIQNHIGDPSKLIDRIGIQAGRSGYFRQEAIKVLAVEKAWHSFLLNYRDQSTRQPKNSVLAYLGCRPAGVFFEPKGEIFTCKAHMVCPWCRYRQGMKVIQKLTPLLETRSHIATLTMYLPLYLPRSPRYHKPESSSTVITEALNRRRDWPEDVVLLRPHYDDFKEAWFAQCTVVAFLTSRHPPEVNPGNLFAPHTAGQQPIVFGGTWQVKKANTKNLHAAVRGALKFDAIQIDKIRGTDFFPLFAGWSRRWRMKYHGSLNRKNKA